MTLASTENKSQTVACSLVSSHLDYANLLFVGRTLNSKGCNASKDP